MPAVPIAIAFQRLFCFHGSDESDSEPYMWCIGFTLDGRTITHAPVARRLSGAADLFFSPGSHGSIGGPMSIGSTRTIPPAVGRFDTTLQPIVLTVAGQMLEVPGTAGLIGILLEEDATSNDGADAAHAAINDLVRIEIEEAVADIDLAGLAAEINDAVAAGTSAAAAATTFFDARMDRLVARIRRYARSTQVPPGRWQVTGVNRQGRPNRRFIAHLGGRFPDGSPWLLTKGKVMDLLGAATHTFFVRGDSGVEADVIIQPDPLNPLFPSVTTTADNDPSNNLTRLPQCPLAIDHIRPVG